jgi:hypothetical protein
MTIRRLRFRRTADDATIGRKAPTTEEKAGAERLKEAGQIIAIFALMLVVLLGLVGIAIDVTYAWREELRVQRAADAAALAGVVYLPGDVTGGVSAAQAEAGKNGFTSVSAHQNTGNPRQMDVTVSARVSTFFLRALGWDHFDVSRQSHAVFIMPVPMGSPDPYYGAAGSYKMVSSPSPITLTGPGGAAMTSRGFWATMLTQGAATSSGDAYLPKKLKYPATGTNPQRDTTHYYDYSIWMPPGSGNGHVWLFDPVFCATDGRYGTGDYWLDGTNPVSAFFYLYNTNNQPYNPSAHTLLGSSGSYFTNMRYYDTDAKGPSGSGKSCKASDGPFSDARATHNKWWDLTAYIGAAGVLEGGASGTTYRIRTTTDPGDSSQDSANAHNQFAIYVTSSGPSAQIYGTGAMENYYQLPQSTSSIFYMAQIDAQAGAGKTVEIRLWDVGDTNGVSSSLQVLQPTSSGWSAASMTWTATNVSGTGAPCPSGSGTSITTFSGVKQYDGCWLTIRIVLPASYSAPQDGWWKVRYTVGTGGSDQATDLTTWEVNVRGNPVHLIP